jgi:hypothetical protein
MNRASGIPPSAGADVVNYPPLQGSSLAVNPGSETAILAVALAVSSS